MTIQTIRNRLRDAPRGSCVISAEERTELDLVTDRLFNSVAGADTLELENEFLNELGALQELLALMSFKHDLRLSDKQMWLVKNFDRSDDLDARRFVVHSIKTDMF